MSRRVSLWRREYSRLTALRARRRSLALVTEADPATIDGIADDSNEGEQERPLLVKAIEKLPERQRQVVTLFYMDERSHEEVATMLAMPVGTVKTLLHRARARLKGGVGSEY